MIEYDYIRDGNAIYEQSFAIIRSEVRWLDDSSLIEEMPRSLRIWAPRPTSPSG